MKENLILFSGIIGVSQKILVQCATPLLCYSNSMRFSLTKSHLCVTQFLNILRHGKPKPFTVYQRKQ